MPLSSRTVRDVATQEDREKEWLGGVGSTPQIRLPPKV
jgi:hypothetical protein